MSVDERLVYFNNKKTIYQYLYFLADRRIDLRL